jgi:hypothetical protein
MRKILISLFASASFVIMMILSGAQASAAAPGCYAVSGETSTKIECSTLKALFPTITIDTEKGCYRTGPPPIYTRPEAFDCNATVATTITPPTTPGGTIGGAVTTPKAGETSTGDISVEDTSNNTNTVALNKCNGNNGKGGDLQDCISKNPLINTFNSLINFVAIGVGVIVIIMVIIGGIQYTTAGGNPQAVSAAKKKILNAVIALVAFLLLYSFMQWLVPGGVF